MYNNVQQVHLYDDTSLMTLKIQVHIIFRTKIRGFPVSMLSELDLEVVQELPQCLIDKLVQIRAENMLTGITMQIFSFLFSK